jgi:MATE family multidrug resistance protein
VNPDPPTLPSLRSSSRQIVLLAWPVLVGQLAVLAFSTVDTVLVARYAAVDLAAMAVGSAAFATVFVGAMGVLLAIGPIVAQHFGAGRCREAGALLHQGVWVALALAVPGAVLLVFPQPFLWMAKASPEVAAKVQAYTLALAVSLPASCLFTVWRGFNTAVSRPKAVMTIQLGALALKVPLSMLLIQGAPTLGIPALGVAGAGIATAIAMWAQVLVALVVLRRDLFYDRFHVLDAGFRLARPDAARIRELLALGLPMGGAILVEVTGFSFMAIFIARLGTEPVAAHQVAANLVGVLFMMPLALSNATGTLVGQRLGAGQGAVAERMAWHGLVVATLASSVLALLLVALRGPVVGLYTHDAAVAAVALGMLPWAALLHVFDAVQTLAQFVLRAFKIAFVSMLVYAVALWGVGLGGGWMLAHDTLGQSPAALRGPLGYWAASTLGIALAAAGLVAAMAVVLRRARRPQSAPPTMKAPAH